MQVENLAFRLAGLPLAEVRYFDTVGSTNDIALTWVEEGAADASLVVADTQTAGRGRLNRQWLTPPGSALAFSLILKPGSVEPERFGLYSPLGALALSMALETHLGLKPLIKWPNDVLLHGRKTAGILAEATWEGQRLQAIILGIGVNVAPESVPPPGVVHFPATCVEAAAGRQVDRSGLLVAILNDLLIWRNRVGLPDFMAEWERRLAFRGQIVTVFQPGQLPRHGTMIGVGSDGSLCLQDEDEEFRVMAGDVSLRLSEIQLR